MRRLLSDGGCACRVVYHYGTPYIQQCQWHAG